MAGDFIDDDDYEGKIGAIIDWSLDNDWFDVGFVEKMQERINEGKPLTDNMRYAIDNIFDKTVAKGS